MIVNAENYKVEIGPIGESSLQSLLTENSTYSSIFILVDENTHEHCLSYIMYQVSGLENAEIIEIPSGEDNKSLEICYQVWYTLTENQANRNALMINLGGGVIGDMGGFIASTYKRGMDYIQIPTSLLSQVDASIGGKVGIDLEGYKNQIGLFSNPRAVFIDPNFLATLSKRELISGLAEMLKHGLALDSKHWNDLKNLDEVSSKTLSSLIADSVGLKNGVVLEDPKEQSIRRKLNYGHTIGHAIEAHNLTQSSDKLLHGECIAIGMIVESFLSLENGLSETEFEEIKGMILNHFDLPKLDPDSFDALIALMKNDKKNRGDEINFTLLKSIGESSVNHNVSEEKIKKGLTYYNSL